MTIVAMSADPDRIRLARQQAGAAKRIWSAMTDYGVEKSPEWATAESIWTEATKLLTEPPPIATQPSDPAKTRAAIAATASALTKHDATQAAAALYAEQAAATMHNEANRQGREWVHLLVERFAKAAEDLDIDAATVPAASAPEAAWKRHRDSRRAAETMAALVAARVTLGDALGETSPGAESDLFMVVAPPEVPPGVLGGHQLGTPEHTEVVTQRRSHSEWANTWAELERTWREEVRGLPDFEHLAELAAKRCTFSLAEFGELQPRRESFRYVKEQFGGLVMLTPLGDADRRHELRLAPVA